MNAKQTANSVEQVDRQISKQVNEKRCSWPMRLIGSASEIGDQPQMRILCATTVAVGIVWRDAHLAGTGLRMLAAHTLATWGKSRIKAIINRTRPDSGDDPRIRAGNSDAHEENSFPSGHSAGAVAVGEAFARSYPGHSTVTRAAAISVSGVQVPRGTHYAGDVLVGMLIGLVAERASNAAIGLLMDKVISDAGGVASER